MPERPKALGSARSLFLIVVALLLTGAVTATLLLTALLAGLAAALARRATALLAGLAAALLPRLVAALLAGLAAAALLRLLLVLVALIALTSLICHERSPLVMRNCGEKNCNSYATHRNDCAPRQRARDVVSHGLLSPRRQH
jgi:hypothetical protein